MIVGKILVLKQLKIVQQNVSNYTKFYYFVKDKNLLFLILGDVQEKIYTFGGVKTLVEVYCKKDVLKESLLLLISECLLNCIEFGL